MTQPVTSNMKISGTTSPEFETVKQLFINQMQTMHERTAQLCVYYKGKKVVDLWASGNDNRDFSADSLANVFSSGKSLEAIAMAYLIDKGFLNYDAKITDYWPEFGTNGKDGVTVADLMRHEAGLANFDTSLDMEDLFTENIKRNSVGRIIEEHTPRFGQQNSSKREYHALTRGWIANELFRRVDPEHRTIGEFLREEISGPLNADVAIGVSEGQMTRLTSVHPMGFGYQLLQSLVPRALGRRIHHNCAQILQRLMHIVPSLIKSNKTKTPPPFSGTTLLGYFNHPHFARGETPSANATCSARGLAKVAAMMSAGGNFDGKQYLSDKAWNALHDNPLEAPMGSFLTTRFTQGGVDCFKQPTLDSTWATRGLNEGREGFYGWMGFGGSIFQWHPEHDIGFAFVPTSLHVLDFFNERGKKYQAEVLKCVAQIRD